MIAEMDSLRVVNRGLLAEVAALQDSLLFYDAIESGQYYRDRNTLVTQIDRLSYDLATCRDEVCIDLSTNVATLQTDDLFEPASATLTEAGAERIANVADTLQAVPGRIRVEAHSDSVPVGGSLVEKYPSNWELSAARAAAVVRHLIDAHELPPGRFEVVSLADTAPVAANTTASGRKQNRRLHFIVLPEEHRP